MALSTFENYYEKVQEEARNLIEDYLDNIVEEVEEGKDLQEEVDEAVWWNLESTFTYVDLHDCAYILEASSRLETDSGLWERLEPIEAVESMAMFTYRNDLEFAVMEMLKDTFEKRKEELEEEATNLEEKLKEVEDSECNSTSEEQEELRNRLEESLDIVEDKLGFIEEAIKYM